MVLNLANNLLGVEANKSDRIVKDRQEFIGAIFEGIDQNGVGEFLLIVLLFENVE